MEYVSIVFIILTSIIALFDGILIHLFQLNLHARSETKYEHFLHSLRALFFTLILIFLFYFRPSGFYLYFSLFLILVDVLVEILDIREEGRSRKIFNGLSNSEYLIHALAMSFRCFGIGLWLSQFTMNDFMLEKSSLVLIENSVLRMIFAQLVFSALIGTIFHFFLIWKPIKLKMNLKMGRCCLTVEN